MPELPEVETIRRVLLPRLKKRKIIGAQIQDPQVVSAPLPEHFLERIQGQIIEDFTRRGKFLRLLFDGGDYLTIHLRMTGCLTVEPQAAPTEKYTRIELSLDDGSRLRYEDMRRLGKFWFTENGERDVSGAEELGVEPFDGSLTALYLRRQCEKSKKSVKSMLLDQSIVAGIGNIYSDEILFSAGIRPNKPCAALSENEFERLASSIPERLAFFIEKNAITFEEYSLSKGREYRNTPYLQVYGKGGTPCPACGATLQRIVLGGRSAVFCPHCQK